MGYLAACEPAAEIPVHKFYHRTLVDHTGEVERIPVGQTDAAVRLGFADLVGLWCAIANPLRRSLFGKPLGRQPLQQNRRRGAEAAEAREALQSSVPIWRGRSSSTISPMTLTNNARISAVSRGAAMALLGASLARKYHRRRGCTITKAQINPNMRYFKNLIEIRCCANH